MTARDLLSAHQLSPKKSFGQNFLHDDSHLLEIARSVRTLATNGLVVEFGAGLGALTRALLDQRLVVHAVERDRDLVPILKSEFADAIQAKQLHLHEDNAATFEWPEPGKEPVTLCGNLPYHLSSVILFRTLHLYQHILGAVYLLQKEVVERIVAPPGNKTYGLLSVLLQARFKVDCAREVAKGAFWPPPKIDSAVLRLITKPADQQPEMNQMLFEQIAKQAFSQRRKTLKNTLQHRYDQVDEWLSKAQIDPTCRAETLSAADFVRLTQIYCSMHPD